MRYLFIILCISSVVELRIHRHRFMHYNHDVGQEIITESSKTYVCSTNSSCEKIKNFQIDEKIDCFDKYLKIKFNITIYNGSQIQSYGFLSENNEILENQERHLQKNKKVYFLVYN